MLALGDKQLTAVLDGGYGLDGGALFRAVPKELWRRRATVGQDNLVRLALRCLLMRFGDRTVLIDTGPGDCWEPEQRDHYRLERPDGGLIEALARHGVSREQVTDVILTHLHDDHAGGVLRRAASGELEASFPAATHHLQRRHLSWARHASELDQDLYPARDLDVLARLTKLHLLDGDTELFDGVELLVSEGHTVGQQLVRVRGGEQTLLCCGDTLPTTAHVDLAWIMGQDLYPLTTVEEKKAILAQSIEDGWILFFSHDPEIAACRVTERHGVAAPAGTCVFQSMT